MEMAMAEVEFTVGDRVIGKASARSRAHIMSDDFVRDANPPGSTKVPCDKALIVECVVKRGTQMFLLFEGHKGEFSAGFFEKVMETASA